MASSCGTEQSPPVQFNTFKTNSSAAPVIGLVKQIAGGSNALANEATQGEHREQADCEAMGTDFKALASQFTAAIVAESRAFAGAKVVAADYTSVLDASVGVFSTRTSCTVLTCPRSTTS